MLNGPVVVLHMMDESTGQSICGLYLDVNKISAFWARTVPKIESIPANPGQPSGVLVGPLIYDGSFVLCDTNKFCVIESGSEIHELMIEAKRTWESHQKNSLQQA